MKREIKFRGKRYGDGGWVYGNLYQGTTDGEQYSIILNDAGYHVAPQDDRNLAIAFAENEVNVVFTQTVGQFTGLLDKNGKEIYEGDVIQFRFTQFSSISSKLFLSEQFIGIITVDKWNNHIIKSNGLEIHISNACEYGVVIGNTHDNPELLKGGAE